MENEMEAARSPHAWAPTCLCLPCPGEREEREKRKRREREEREKRERERETHTQQEAGRQAQRREERGALVPGPRVALLVLGIVQG